MRIPKLYRKRFIPNELVLLKNDEILEINEDIILTKWKTLKPRLDFARGYSCYYLKKGFKISRFIDKNNICIYTYCDIIDVEHNSSDTDEYSYIFNDLLIDVVVYENGQVKVLDLAEISEALDKNIISIDLVKKTLRLTDELLSIIYSGMFDNYTRCFDNFE